MFNKTLETTNKTWLILTSCIPAIICDIHRHPSPKLLQLPLLVKICYCCFTIKKQAWVSWRTLPRPPETDRLALVWDCCNTIVMSWVTNFIENDISKSILWMDATHEIWTDLCGRYNQGDLFRVSDLQEELFTLKQGDQTITQYYTNLKKLWQELDNVWPFPTCSCNPKCSCGLLPTFKFYCESDHVIHFLKGLNKQYAYVRSQIMTMNSLPLISKTFSLLIQQERQTLVPSNDDTTIVANFSKPNYQKRPHDLNNKASNYGRDIKVCT